MLLRITGKKDFLFHGTDSELCQLWEKDKKGKNKVLVLGSVPKAKRIEGIDYIANKKTAARVKNTFSFLGSIRPYEIIYDLCGLWKLDEYIIGSFVPWLLEQELQRTIRIKRVTKDDLISSVQSNNSISFNMKPIEKFIYK